LQAACFVLENNANKDSEVDLPDNEQDSIIHSRLARAATSSKAPNTKVTKPSTKKAKKSAKKLKLKSKSAEILTTPAQSTTTSKKTTKKPRKIKAKSVKFASTTKQPEAITTQATTTAEPVFEVQTSNPVIKIAPAASQAQVKVDYAPVNPPQEDRPQLKAFNPLNPEHLMNGGIQKFINEKNKRKELMNPEDIIEKQSQMGLIPTKFQPPSDETASNQKETEKALISKYSQFLDPSTKDQFKISEDSSFQSIMEAYRNQQQKSIDAEAVKKAQDIIVNQDFSYDKVNFLLKTLQDGGVKLSVSSDEVQKVLTGGSVYGK
jgi:hypothetical protein